MANGTRVLKRKSREKEACHGFNTNAYNHEFTHRCAPRAGKLSADEDREASEEMKMTQLRDSFLFPEAKRQDQSGRFAFGRRIPRPNEWAGVVGQWLEFGEAENFPETGV